MSRLDPGSTASLFLAFALTCVLATPSPAPAQEPVLYLGVVFGFGG